MFEHTLNFFRLLVIVLLFSVVRSAGQTTTIVNPAGNGGFESGSTWAANGWTAVNNGQSNKWYVGTIPTGLTGVNCAFVGNSATVNSYNTGSASVSHFYRDITIPAGQSNVTLSFNWKCFGEGSFDFIKVFVVPTTTTLTAGTILTTGQVGTQYNLSSSWQSASITLPCTYAGTTQRLVFTWVNDGSVGTDPPGCIDNISVISSASSVSCTSLLGTGVTTVSSLPYNSGSGTTCGAVNDLNSSNTAVCGATYYMDGEDRVWIFTPTATGQVTINLDAPSASWTGLMLYQGCPVTSGCSAAGSAICITQVQSSSGSKNICVTLTAGVTYYLILDSYPSPTCNAFNALTISAPTSGTPACSSLLGNGYTSIPSLPYNSGAGTTCGMGNDLTSSNTATCGATYYLDGEDRVWSFTPNTSGQMTIDLTAPAATYTGLMLYQGCPASSTCGSPSTATCVAVSQSYQGSKSICVTVTAGVTYYLILDSWPSPTCNPYDNLFFSAVTSTASGTVCSNAVPIPSLPYSATSHTTACAGNDYSSTTPGICNATFAAGEDRVYVFNSTTAQCLGINLTGASSNDIGFSVYQGCPGAAGSVCIGNAGLASAGNLSSTITLPGAGTYYIIIDSQSPTTSVSYNLQIISFGSGAANDRPYQAVLLPFNISISGDNSCSGNADEPAAPSCFGPAGNTLNTVWYRFIAPASGCVRMKTTLGTLSNTQIALYGPVSGTIAAGSGPNLALISCNDDLPPCGTNTYPTSTLNATGLTPGMTYYISVDGYGALTGSFTIYIMDSGTNGLLPFPPTPGQDCTAAFPVCTSNIIVPNPGPQAVGSTCEFGSSSNCLASGERGSYWYRINISANGFLEFDIIPNDWTGAPSTACTDYDFAIWKTASAGIPGPANCNNLGTTAPVQCNYNYLGVTGCFSPVAGTSPAAYPGFGAAYQPRIAVSAGDEYLLIVSNFTNSTSGFALNISPTTPVNAVPSSGGTLVWTGSLNNDWYNSENWGGCSIPNCVYNVSIPPVANQPSISGLNATCGSIDISAGASLTLQSGSQLKVCNNFMNNGTINAMSNSTLILQSDSIVQNQYMSGSLTGSNRLWNLSINKPNNTSGNTVFLSNDLENAGNFTIGTSATYAGGNFVTGGKYHKVGGNFSVWYTSTPYSNYDASASTLEFNGNLAQNYFNRGNLNNVVMNHTGPGLTLGNSGATDWMMVAGNLTMTQGKILTGANRVNVVNNLSNAVSAGNTTSFVDGNLRRSFSATGGSYDFPVGSALKGFQRINFNFTSTNDRSYAVVSFVNTAPPVQTPFLGPECVTNMYDQTPLNNGYWLVSAVPATGVAPFNTTVYPTGYTNAAPGFSLMRRASATSAWGLEGSCIYPGPITAIQRTGMTTMGTSTGFAIAQALSPLPVELLFVDAVARTKSIEVEWSTASEINNAGFEVLRSVSGTDWQTIGWVPGHGSTSNTQHYTLDDKQVADGIIYYYRLRQTDYDGNSTLSGIVSAKLGNVRTVISAWPNPFDSGTQILLNLSEETDIRILIINDLGQITQQLDDSRREAGSHFYTFDPNLSHCAKGIYLLYANIGGQIERIRLVAE